MNRQAMDWEKILAKYIFVERFASEIHVISNTNSPILKMGKWFGRTLYKGRQIDEEETQAKGLEIDIRQEIQTKTTRRYSHTLTRMAKI